MADGAETERSGMSGRAIGLTVAAVVALIAAGFIGWSLLGARTSSQAPAPETRAEPTPETTPEQIAAAPEPTDVQDLVQAADEGRIELLDEQDRVVRELLYDRLEPRESGRFEVSNPRAWLYMDGGQSVRIESERLYFRRPPGASEPESGRFVGAVVISVFDGRLDTREARESAAAVTTMRTDELHFDSALGQVSTRDTVRLAGGGVEATFEGLDVVVDEVRERLAHMSTVAGGRIVYRRDEAASGEDGVAAGGDAGATGEGRIDLYAAVFEGEVRVVSGARRLEADRLETWARLIDGALPEDAVAGFLTAAGDDGASGDDGTGGGEAADEPIELTWTGPLRITPLDEAPETLADDDLAARFSAPESGAVRIVDEAADGFVRCVALDYGLTTRRLALAGAGPTGVTLRMDGVGETVCGRLEADLTTGVARVTGPGALTAAPEAGDAPSDVRRITWQRGADFTLATVAGQVDFARSWPLEEARFDGEVVAREGDAEVTGDEIVAAFEEAPGGGPALRRVVVGGGGRAVSPGQGSLAAERLTVDFETRAADGRLTPTMVTAEGRAVAERERDTLRAELLTAHVGREPVSGDLRVERLEAELDVALLAAGGEEAYADRLEADPLTGVYDLVGEPVVLRRGGSSVTAGSMRIEEIERRLTVFGQGVLNHSERRESGPGYERVQVEWAGSMTFDGVMEQAEFVGDCVARAEPDDLTRDTLRGHRIVVDLELDDEGASAADRPASALRRAQVIGEAEEFGEGDAAQIETRRYVEDEGSETGLRLAFLAYLDGPTIIADAVSDTMAVPSAGRLLFEDRRQSSADEDAEGTRGTTLFEWDGAARFDRSEGGAVMTRRVRVRRKAPDSQRVTQLECERLNASFTAPTGEPDEATASLDLELRRAVASGAVYARQGARQLIADTLVYDPAAGVSEATAAEGNLVTLYDADDPIPLTGTVLRWDMARDRIEWKGAGTTATPR